MTRQQPADHRFPSHHPTTRHARRLTVGVLLVTAALASALVLVLVGLTSVPGSAEPATGTAASATSGPTVTVAVPALPVNFNPSTAAGSTRVTAEVMSQVWPQTFVTDPRYQQVLAPGVIDSAEVIGVKPFTVEYIIDSKATWSDGVPITASDFIYNWQQQLRYGGDAAQSGLVAGYRAVASISGSDNGHTLTVVFRHDYAEWESLFADLVPAHIARQFGWVAAFNGFNPAMVISGGPFEITQYLPGKRLVLSRNPHWWLTPPHIARIVLEVMTPAAALQGIADGSVTMSEVPPGPDVPVAIAAAARHGIHVVDSLVGMPYLWQLCFNMTGSTLSDAMLRRAIEHSLDLPLVVADSEGLVDATASPAAGRLTIVPATASSSSASSSSSSASSSPPADVYAPRTAMRLFDEAGYVEGPNGYLRLGGVGAELDLSLLVPEGGWMVSEVADQLVAQLQAVGVNVTEQRISLQDLLANKLPEGRYELALAPFLADRYASALAPVYTTPVLPASQAVPPVVLRPGAGTGPTMVSDPTLSWNVPTPVGEEPAAVDAGVVTRDVFGLDDAAVDRKLTAALSALSLTNEQTLLGTADDLMTAAVPTIPIFQSETALVRAKDLVNVSQSPTLAGPFWNADSWAIRTPATAGSGHGS